jgi:transcriptional regulator with XRE-family HTH domain
MSLLTKLLISRSVEMNLSQIELARLVGVSGPAISMFFSGRIIKFAKWRELATALEINHDKMLELTNIAATEAAHATKKARAEQRDKGEPCHASILNYPRSVF